MNRTEFIYEIVNGDFNPIRRSVQGHQFEFSLAHIYLQP